MADYPPEMQALAERLRSLVRRAIPDAMEAVYPGWKLIGYRRPVQGGSAYFSYVAPQAAGVALGFEYGILMDDPHGVLQGTGSQVRYVMVSRLGEVRAKALVPLIRQAAEVAALPRAVLLERLRGAAPRI